MFLRTGSLVAALLAVLAAALGVASAGAPSPLSPSITYREPPALGHGPHPDRQIEMLGRKIGQMLLIGFAGTRPDEPGPRRIAAMIGAGEIGGVVLFADNVRSPAQLDALTAAFIAAGGATPPFIAIDQEGGSIQRLNRRKGFRPLPSARSMARKTVCDAHDLYAATAAELADHHINLNLGPVVDLDVYPRSPAIGGKARSYDRDPATVLAYADAFIAAHHAAGVLTAAKHFPGHGSAVRDPHHAIVDISDTWQPEELAPFAELVASGRTPMVMIGHLIHPRFSDGDRPASLSRRAITEVLRQDLGFDGLVVTDDLGMDAVARRFAPEEAAVMAIRAGADLLIFANQPAREPPMVERIVAAVAGAVASGRLPVSAVEASYARLRAARAALGARPGPARAAAPCAEAGPAGTNAASPGGNRAAAPLKAP
jgi:beta-N-acetylhexosaminidase